jgi:hypothetical protein
MAQRRFASVSLICKEAVMEQTTKTKREPWNKDKLSGQKSTMQNDDEVLRIQLRVSRKSAPELYEVLKAAGRYHQCKRISVLALKGLLAESGTVAVGMPHLVPAPEPIKNEVKDKLDASNPGKNTGDGTHYDIPESARDAICGMLDSFGL